MSDQVNNVSAESISKIKQSMSTTFLDFAISTNYTGDVPNPDHSGNMHSIVIKLTNWRTSKFDYFVAWGSDQEPHPTTKKGLLVLMKRMITGAMASALGPLAFCEFMKYKSEEQKKDAQDVYDHCLDISERLPVVIDTNLIDLLRTMNNMGIYR